MDVLITHIYDVCRFKYYIKSKFNINAGANMADDINNGYYVRLNGLPECDVRYLQSMKYECIYDRPQICKLKIIS